MTPGTVLFIAAFGGLIALCLAGIAFIVGYSLYRAHEHPADACAACQERNDDLATCHAIYACGTAHRPTD
ncbi:hypothetical protein ACIQU5_28050 [Streptomyces sp. NPDC090306]|uniref:hypothetical protein n=1 Tax=Streptomyces sp. NPDC090306 TaxID=3365961 RepID=UPI0038234798